MLPVVGVAVGIAKRNQFLFAAVEEDAKNLVLHFVAYIEEAGLVPDWPFGEAKIARNLRQLRLAVEQLPEFWRLGGELEGTLRDARPDGNEWQTSTEDNDDEPRGCAIDPANAEPTTHERLHFRDGVFHFGTSSFLACGLLPV